MINYGLVVAAIEGDARPLLKLLADELNSTEELEMLFTPYSDDSLRALKAVVHTLGGQLADEWDHQLAVDLTPYVAALAAKQKDQWW